MRIKLNNREHTIKPASLLTVREYIKLSEKASYSLIDYLSVVTGKRFGAIAETKISNRSIKKLYAFIGGVTPFDNFMKQTSIKRSYPFDGKVFNYEDLDYETLGVRMLMEQKASDIDNIIELVVYLLAVLIEKTYDSEKVEKIYNQLLDANYIDTFEYACFFFKKFKNGLSKGSGSLITRLKELIISMLTKSKRSREDG